MSTDFAVETLQFGPQKRFLLKPPPRINRKGGQTLIKNQKEVIREIILMAHEHLVKWGRDAFEKGLSLAHIENYLLKRGLKKHEALKVLHEITSFEHKIHKESENIRKLLISIPILIMLIVAGMILLYFAGILKLK